MLATSTKRLRDMILFCALVFVPFVQAEQKANTNESQDPASSQALETGLPDSNKPVGRAPKQASSQVIEQLAETFDERGALTPKHTFVIEPSWHFSHSSANRVAIEAFTLLPAITVGAIDVSEVRRDTLIAALGFRYGLTNRLEIDVKVPYVYREDNVRERPLLEGAPSELIKSTNGSGLGDVEAALHYQFNRGLGGVPYFIGNLSAKAPTGKDPFEVDREFLTDEEGVIIAEQLTEQPRGSGFWSIQPSLTVIYPTDPAVLYGNLSYTWNFERDIGGGTGRIDPGDFVGFNFGMGFAINQRMSFSLGYEHTIIFDTTQENGNALESEFDRLHVGSFLFGVGYRATERMSINLSLGIGVTEDSPDVGLTLRTPLSF